jgi:hypothetical protein
LLRHFAGGVLAGNLPDTWEEESFYMTLMSIVTTVIVAGVLAVGTAVGVVQLNEQTPSNTKPVTEPLVTYGQR